MHDLIVPDLIGEIVGWRAWRVIGGNAKLPMLSSVTHTSTIWHPGHWTHAVCAGKETCGRSNDGRVPGESCKCGLYAARDRSHLVKLGYARENDRAPVVFIGEVGLAGKVIPGQQGWRAEKGRIVRLYVPFHHWRHVDALEDLYGVETLLDNTLKPEGASFAAEGGE